MLHYQAIDSTTLELLKKLIRLAGFEQLRLAGGTSLALQYGHRKSIDLDLFGEFTLDTIMLSSYLGSMGEVKILQNLQHIKSYLINGIKVDIVNYPYPWIGPLLSIDQVRLASDRDIGAMKLAAITGRGAKKDFFDLYFLLKRFTLRELLSFYNQKYMDGSAFMVIKSLVYFEDAEADVDPVQLIPASWSDVKSSIVHHQKEYLDNLT